MKIQKVLTVAYAMIVALSGKALAEYMIGGFQDSLEATTHIVDAKVTAITKERYARLELLHHIKGTNAPTLLTGTALSCTHDAPGAFGMQAGKRYIIMLQDTRLFEETTFFEITKRDDGSLGCHLSDFHKKWMGSSNSWMTLEEMTMLMSPPKQK